MSKKRVFAGVILAFIGLSGCGLSPQTLAPQPQITEQFSRVANGQQVYVSVMDNRPSPVLGSRGGSYADTSTVSVKAERILPRLRAEIDTVLRQQGFIPVSQPTNGAELVVSLESLTYKVPNNSNVANKVIVTAQFKATAHKLGQNFTGSYNANIERGFVVAPNQEKNERVIAEALSDALVRVFKDPSLTRILAQ
ncbi:YajG family lipoprotein [Pseudomonas sp. F1_0610]|uniref:YajG family lipoprotein n=1 Tax=Pseudomonas sp. F1_0610 TaxID=3114284 RepID=UPI0039C05E43